MPLIIGQVCNHPSLLLQNIAGRMSACDTAFPALGGLFHHNAPFDFLLDETEISEWTS